MSNSTFLYKMAIDTTLKCIRIQAIPFHKNVTNKTSEITSSTYYDKKLILYYKIMYKIFKSRHLLTHSD